MLTCCWYMDALKNCAVETIVGASMCDALVQLHYNLKACSSINCT